MTKRKANTNVLQLIAKAPVPVSALPEGFRMPGAKIIREIWAGHDDSGRHFQWRLLLFVGRKLVTTGAFNRGDPRKFTKPTAKRD